MNRDNSLYELRVNPAWNPTHVASERFDDALTAFQRHAAIERSLVTEGWILEAFESDLSRQRNDQLATDVRYSDH